MMINAWNRMCALDDEFVARFISIFNIVITLLIQLSLAMLGATFLGHTFAKLKGSYMNTFHYSSSSLFLSFFYGFIWSLIIILGIVLVFQKIKNNNVVNPNIGNFNNNVFNKPLLTTYQAAVFLFIVSCFLLFHFMKKLKFFSQNPLLAITVHLFCFVLFPIILVPNKKKCIKFLLRELF